MIETRTVVLSTLAASTLALISGCAFWSDKSANATPAPLTTTAEHSSAVTLVAADFVHALRQIPALLPSRTTINLLDELRSDAFIAALRQALDQSGYAVRWVEDIGNTHLLLYRLEHEAGNTGAARIRYDVAVDAIELRRTYLHTGERNIRPVTPLYIKGADASAVVLNDAVFNVEGSGAAQTGLSSFKVPSDANPLKPLIHETLGAKSLTLPLIALPDVQNVFELGVSNYKATLAKYRIVSEQILTFPNDSLRLGKTNKKLIEQLVSRFDPATDLFSLIGCSLGPTRVNGGNAALALGRASRVREALLFSGVSQSKILDEGCWAGDSADNTLPARGVVITLNRQV